MAASGGGTGAIGRGRESSPTAKEKPRTIWEWRGFWAKAHPSLAPAGPLAALEAERFVHSRITDRYLLIPGRWDSIKLRQDRLEIKRLLERCDGFCAFRRKKTYKFPLAAARVGTLFPRLAGGPAEIAEPSALDAELVRADYQPRWTEVVKERYRLALGDHERIEFSSLDVGEASFLSLCIEGPSHATVTRHLNELAPAGGEIMGYPEFLERRGSEP